MAKGSSLTQLEHPLAPIRFSDICTRCVHLPLANVQQGLERSAPLIANSSAMVPGPHSLLGEMLLEARVMVVTWKQRRLTSASQVLGLKDCATIPGATHNLLTIPPDEISDQRDFFKTQLIWPSTLLKNCSVFMLMRK